MIPAYNGIYLDDAQSALGGAVEYAVLQCGMDGQRFLELFVTSGVAEEFGKGNPLLISGKSGIELAKLIFERVGEKDYPTKDLPYVDYPPEYWVGWILAFYQWQTGRSFDAIIPIVTYKKVYKMYHAMHEADPRKAATVFDAMFLGKETKLANIRKSRGLSQSQLANRSGVSIRSIQLFEQHKTNINNAQYNNLKALADALNCRVEELLEE